MGSQNLQLRQLAKAAIFDGALFSISGLLFFSISTKVDADTNAILKEGFRYVLFSLAVFFIFSIILKLFRAQTLGQRLFLPQSSIEHRAWYRVPWKWQLYFLGLTIVVGTAHVSGISFQELFDSDGFQGAKELFKGLLSPDISLFPVAIVKLGETLSIAFMATFLSLPIAAMISFLSAKNLANSPLRFLIYLILRVYLNFLRSIEPVIWAVIFAVWVGIGPFAGMLALFIQSIASLAKQFSESIESVQVGPIEGIMATGASRFQTVWLGILPQVTMPFLSFALYRWDTNVRMATIIGMAGGGGIGTLLYQYSMRAQWPQVGSLILVVSITVALLDLLSAYVREALK